MGPDSDSYGAPNRHNRWRIRRGIPGPVSSTFPAAIGREHALGYLATPAIVHVAHPPERRAARRCKVVAVAGAFTVMTAGEARYCLPGNSTFAATNNLISTLPDPGNTSYCTGVAAPRT